MAGSGPADPGGQEGRNERSDYAVVIVPSTSHAMRAEAALQRAGIGCKMIPVPRHLSSDCGICVRIAREDQAAARAALDGAAVEWEGMHDC